MSLISSKKKSIMQSVKLSIETDLLEEIGKYNEFAKIGSTDDFFIEAAKYILDNDKDWKKHKKANRI